MVLLEPVRSRDCFWFFVFGLSRNQQKNNAYLNTDVGLRSHGGCGLLALMMSFLILFG